ncbi:helix-turn-helix transcriptional regulator [Vreelandella aquamarina]|uniref:helix-turn-helix transcriptional regulator n=1 Tax=Vreelandella aquamarina TaxID=77097 RepID=UPI00384DADEA
MQNHKRTKRMATKNSVSIKCEKIQLLRRSEVLARCAFSNSTLHRLIKRGEFPKPIKLGSRAVAWIESEVNGWIRQRVEEARGKAGNKY